MIFLNNEMEGEACLKDFSEKYFLAF